jgi:two-component system, NtrC family, sensor histidine kinase HydH
MLLNMVLNAIQAMPEGGMLTLATRWTQGGEIELEVADTGMGIAPDKLGQIFKPFFTDKHRGSGLGLAIAKNIIDKHRGRITVSSIEDQGSRFTIIFPPAGR